MKFKVLPQSRASEMLDQMDPPRNGRPSVGLFESRAGTGELVGDEVFTSLATALRDLQAELGTDTKQFDAEACVLVHSALPDDSELLSNEGFWRWLALGPFQGVVLNRFPPGKRIAAGPDGPPPRINRPNFGVGASARQRSECYPYKLWLRGELGHVAGEHDPYRFAKRGDVDFWTSHIHRQTYTTNRALCRALVHFQYPDERAGRPRLAPGTDDPAKNRFGIRTLAKRLRRLQASFELSVLEEERLEELVSELAKGLTPAR